MPCSTRSYEDDLDDGLSDSDLILAGDVHTSSNLTNVQYSDDTVDDNDLLAAEACFGRGTWHGRFRFLDLPIELRLMIYRICLLSDQEIGLPRFCSWYFKRDPAVSLHAPSVSSSYRCYSVSLEVCLTDWSYAVSHSTSRALPGFVESE